jgi:hypothetical protein
MAKNETRSMTADFAQGTVDETYISVAPDRGGVIDHYPYDRLTWPTYMQAERHIDPPFMEAHIRRAGLPTERKAPLAR